MSVRFRPLAGQELTDAARRYEARVPGLGDALVAEVLATTSLPPGYEIRMPRAELENMLKDLAQAFLDAANVACPGMASHPRLLAWTNELTVRGHGEEEP